MKRTLGTLVAGLGLALLTVIMFSNTSSATGAPADFDAVVAQTDSAIAAFDAVTPPLKAISFFDTRLGKVKTGVTKAKGQVGGSKRVLGATLKATGTILRGIRSRLSNSTARRQIQPESTRLALVALIDDLSKAVKALK